VIFGLFTGLHACDQPGEKRVSPAPVSSVSGGPSVVFLGTSLTAGLGIEPEQAYPALIQQKIDSAGLGYRVVNAGVSGESSAGARRRIDWLLREPVAVLVLETGANDGLRGLPPDSLRANIQAILDRARQVRPSARLVLVGMRVPPNYGRTYSQQFAAIYPELARANGATLVPFLLEGVGGVAALNQPDGVHPTAEGQRKMAESVWRVLRPMLEDDSLHSLRTAAVREEPPLRYRPLPACCNSVVRSAVPMSSASRPYRSRHPRVGESWC
jgi:acyl-CoA thioesterase I